jgi:hypothetical protein
MLFNKEQKVCFYEPNKTGSTTARMFLAKLGWNFLRPIHGTPDQFVQKYPALSEYKSFVFFRDPLGRFMSIVHSIKRGADTLHMDAFRTNENSAQTTNPSGDVLRTWADVIADISPKDDPEKTLSNFTYEDVVNNFDKFQPDFGMAFRPQISWMNAPNLEVLDFDNYESELRRISGAADPDAYPIALLNVSPNKYRGEVTPAVIDLVRTIYAEDYKFAKEMLGKEY